MSYSITLSLTDELYHFVNGNAGKGTLYTSPSEFLRQLIRERKKRIESYDGKLEKIRNALIEGEKSGSAGELNMTNIKQVARLQAGNSI